MTKLAQSLSLLLVSLQLSWGLPSDSIFSPHSTQTLRPVPAVEGDQKAGLEEALGGGSKVRTKPVQLTMQVEPLENRVLLAHPLPPVLAPEPAALVGEPIAGIPAAAQGVSPTAIDAALAERQAAQGESAPAERFDLTVPLGNYTRVRVNTLDPERIAITYSRTPFAGPRGDFIQTHTVKLTNERIQVHTSDQEVYGGPVRVTDKVFRPGTPRYDRPLEQAISTMQTTIGAEPNPGRNAQLQAVLDRLVLLRQGVTFIGTPAYESNPLPVGAPLVVTVTLRNPTEEPVRLNLNLFLVPRFSAGFERRFFVQKVLLRPGTQSITLTLNPEQLAGFGIVPREYDLSVVAFNNRGGIKELARINGPVLTVTLEPVPIPVIEGGFENFLFVSPPGAALISGYRVEMGTEQLVSGPNGPGTRIQVPITLINVSTGEAAAAGSRLYARQTDGSRGSLILESQTHGVEDRFITYNYSDPQNPGRITRYSVTERKQILDISDGPPFLRTVVLQGSGEYLYRDRELSLVAETIEGTDARTGKRYRFVRDYELAVTDIQIPSGAISIGIEWVGSSVSIPRRYAVSSENGGTVFYVEQNTGQVERYSLQVPYPVDAFQLAFVYRDGSVRFQIRQPNGASSGYVAVDLETGREDMRPFAVLGAQRYRTVDGRYLVLLDTPLGPVDDFLTVFDRQTGRLEGVAAYSDDNIYGAGTYEASQLEYHPESGALSGFLDGRFFSAMVQREPETPGVDPYLQTQIDSTDAAKDVLVVTSSDPSLSGPRVQRYDYPKGAIQSAEIVAGSVVVDLTDGVEILPDVQYNLNHQRISLTGDSVVSVKEYLAQQQLAGHPLGYFEVITQSGQTLRRYVLHSHARKILQQESFAQPPFGFETPVSVPASILSGFYLTGSAQGSGDRVTLVSQYVPRAGLILERTATSEINLGTGMIHTTVYTKENVYVQPDPTVNATLETVEGTTESTARPGEAGYNDTLNGAITFAHSIFQVNESNPDLEVPKAAAAIETKLRELQARQAAGAIDAMLAEREAGRAEPIIAAQQRVAAVLGELAEAAQGNHVVVFDAETLSNRIDLQEFAARVPDGLKERVVLLGNSEAARQAAARNGITIVGNLDEILAARPEAETIGFVGSAGRAEALKEMLRYTSITVVPIDPGAGLDRILREMGIPSALLRQVDTDALRRALEQLFSA